MRETLSQNQVAPLALQAIENFHSSVVNEVKTAVSQNKYVVVGMGQNPFCSKACKLLEAKSLPFKYLEYGNYFSQWKPRLAIKIWSGWPTYPQVFINGQLIGGFKDLEKLSQDGMLK